MKLLNDKWGLPFDYKGFDHQPTTSEIVCIVGHLCRAAETNVPRSQLDSYRILAENILSGFRNSTLIATDNNVTQVYQVEGGLMSGLRWTTAVGNGWNTVMTQASIRTLQALGISSGSIERWIRGDDSAIYCTSWAQAMAMKLGYDAMDVESVAGKYAIHEQAMEFLRVWYSPTAASGYPARAIPGITQRKPWSSGEWVPFQPLTAVREALSTLQRRGLDQEMIQHAWRAIKATYARKSGTDTRWFQVPSERGGPGIDVWQGWLPDKGLPNPSRLITVETETNWTRDRVHDHANELGLPTTVRNDERVAEDRLQAKLSADDVLDVSARYRSLFKKRLKEQKVVWRRVPMMEQLPVYQAFEQMLGSVAASGDALKNIRYTLRNRAVGYGEFSWLKNDWDFVNEYLEDRRQIREWLKTTCIDAFRSVTRLERHGLRRREAYSWIFGEIGYSYQMALHPALHELVELGAAAMMGDPNHRMWKPNEWSSTVVWGRRMAEHALSTSPLALDVYSW
jgi:hypothetical protein